MNLVRRLPFLLILMGSMVSPPSYFATTGEASSPQFNVESTMEGLIVEWHAPGLQIELATEGRSVLHIPGYAQVSLPGAPRLPYTSVLVALPPGSLPTIEILNSTETTVRLPAPLALADQPEGVQVASDGSITGGAFIPAQEERTFSPQEITLESVGILRGVHLARLSFYPALPSGDSLQLVSHIEAKVNFNAVIQPSSAAVVNADPLLATVKSAVINPDHLQIGESFNGETNPGLVSQNSEIPIVAIEVSEKGLTEVTFSDLQAANFPLDSINPDDLQLTRDGNAIAYQLLGDEDSIFEATESLRFFADPQFSRWSSEDTYLLSAGASLGLRMETRSADPAGVTAGVPWAESLFEDNKIYTPDCYCAPIPAGRDGDRWVWHRLQLPEPFLWTHNFQLSGVDQSRPAEMTLWLIGFTDLEPDPDHRVQIELNGQDLGTVEWDGKNAYQADLAIPANILNEGENTIKITLLEIEGVSVDGVWLDAFSIRYPLSDSASAGGYLGFGGEDTQYAYTVSMSSASGLLAYDVSDADKPVELTDFELGAGDSVTLADPAGGGSRDYWLTTPAEIQSPVRVRQLAPSLLGQNFTGAEYLVIAPAQFIPALQDLIELRQLNGLKVAVEDTQAIYDAYSEGLPEPSAIRSFLAHAYVSWGIRPVFVLLVGDGTSDPRRYNPTSSETYIPPYLAEVDPWIGETAADNLFVAIDGEDSLPDMLIGRLPVNDIAELNTVVSKIVRYETQPEFGIWQHRATLIADNADTAGNFPFLSELLLQKFPSPPFSPQRLYYSPSEDTEEDFRQEVQQAWNDGTSLLMYTGHASIHQWAVEIFFHLIFIDGDEEFEHPGLENDPKLPVLLEMTCLTGSFQVPGLETLDEALLRHPDGGVVAAWGPSGLGVSTGHHWLAEGFMESVYRHELNDMGTATLAGKLNLVTVGAYADLIDTFTLLGDPATKLERSYSLYMPLTQN